MPSTSQPDATHQHLLFAHPRPLQAHRPPTGAAPSPHPTLQHPMAAWEYLLAEISKAAVVRMRYEGSQHSIDIFSTAEFTGARA